MISLEISKLPKIKLVFLFGNFLQFCVFFISSFVLSITVLIFSNCSFGDLSSKDLLGSFILLCKFSLKQCRKNMVEYALSDFSEKSFQNYSKNFGGK